MSAVDSDNSIRGRVLKLELKVEEVTKKVDSLNAYIRQLHDYLNQLSRS
jgi:hypothetical protein